MENIIFAFDSFLFKLQNVYFLETKNNIIMDGFFTKFIYSDEYLTMNGIYLTFPIKINNLDNKCIYFQPFLMNNLSLIKEISNIENQIIDYYKTVFSCNKKPVYLLSKQLYNGMIRFYKEKQENYVIKISGIWENKTDIGITYKIL